MVEILKDKSIQEEEVATVVEEEEATWMTPIMEYLKDETLPGDRKEASKLRIKARQYKLLEGILYRRSFLKPWLRCVGPLQADYVIREIHEGSCTMHAGPRSVVAKAIRLGYYWPTMHRDTWPFYKWGIDIAGPFLEGPGKVKFLIVAMDYFMKWIEEKAVATITGNQIKELPHVLWAHRTMIKSSHGDTPFSLTYGTEAVIPAEIGMPIYRTAAVDTVHNDEELWLNSDLLEEKRERTTICEAKAKMKMTKYYNARVCGVAFRPGDFVYRSNDASHAAAGGKLGPKWEGPYEVTEALGDGAYKLRTMDGTDLPRTWNIANLKKCYL
ncbi:reverse transcriptase domain-containing protein [Tanacetum coccineum]